MSSSWSRIRSTSAAIAASPIGASYRRAGGIFAGRPADTAPPPRYNGGMGCRSAFGGLAIMCALAMVTGTAHAARPALRIEVLSNRADLISGGDALVQIERPAGALSAPVAADVDGRDVTGAFSDGGGGGAAGLGTRRAAGP